MKLSTELSFAASPLLPTAILLLATGSSWRARRGWAEAVGLGAGGFLLAITFSWLPPVVFTALLPCTSILAALLVLAWSEWRFAPDRGQTGFAWALQAALRPTLGAALGAAAGYWPVVFLSHSPFLPIFCTLTLVTGLIAAHAIDQAFTSDPADAQRPLPDDDGNVGPPVRPPETILT